MTQSTNTPRRASYFDTPPAPRDRSLFLTTTATWDDCRRNLHALISEAPGVRPTIARFIDQGMNLQSSTAYLTVMLHGELTPRRIELEDACLFLARQPDLDTQDLSALSATVPAEHALSGRPLHELLTQLKALDPTAFVIQQWDSYWNARQPDTAVSRRDHALQQYHDHLHCACELAYAQGQLTLEQLKPLRLAIEAPEGVAKLGDQPILIDTLSLTADASVIRRLPGALVFTVEGQALASQLLYLPSHTPALTAFPDRGALEQHLLAQKVMLWPGETRLSTDDQLVYGRQPGISAAFFELVGLLRNNLVSYLYQNPGNQLADAGAQTLASADAFDALRRDRVLLAHAPTLPAGDLDADAAPSLFGQLHSNLELGSRQASIKLQRDAFAALMDAHQRNPSDDPDMQRLTQAIDHLHQQQDQARTAASALLIAEKPNELVELATRRSADYQALLTARLEGLKAEAQIQHALKQLDDTEYAAITQVTDWPVAAQRLNDDIVAATLQLTLTEEGNPQAQALDAALLITHKEALTDPAASHSLLVYWPGEGGGLQRFASRNELQRQLLKITHEDEALTLSFNLLRGHALAHGLLAQLQDCENAAKALVGQFAVGTGRAAAKQALASLREQHLLALLIPSHDARETAYAHILEVDHSSVLHQHLPDWLSTLALADRGRLKDLIQQYVPALRQSQALLERELIDREVFVRKRLRERLDTALGLKEHYQVSFDLPESVSFVRDIVAGSGAPSTPIKLIPQPSNKRTTVTLEHLALQNVDDDMRLRFDYMLPVITGGTQEGRTLLEATMTFAYVKTLVTELDLAGAYTQLIREVFTGKPQASRFQNDHRREQLLKPFQLMLRMQSIYGQHRHLLDAPAQQILDSAIDAGARNATHVVLHAARMQTDERVNDSKGTELSGIGFIEAPISGQTLLYLTDDPRGQYLSYHASLDEARKALFSLTLDANMANYLADRALLGDEAIHLARLRDAHLKHYDALIEVSDATLAASVSLADFLLQAQMQRLIEIHRSSSRSNQARQLELATEKRELIFTFVKMGVGMVPFIGTAVGLYDGVQAASLMINAIGRKDTVETLVQFESVMLCFIDAAMDLVPGAGVASVRGATQSRHLRGLRTAPGSLRVRARKTRHGGERFAGYEYTKGVDLSGLQPARLGKYRNVYRHAKGDFIVEDGRTFQVEYHDSPATWRLKGTRSKTYKQPIALDEAGQWNTHGALYGTLVNGGLAGGGGTLGHLADNIEPFWPEPIRRYLPRWLTDRTVHRQQALSSSIFQKITALQAQRQRSASLRDAATVNAADRPRAEASSKAIVQQGEALYQDLVKESAVLLRRNLRRNIEFRSDIADLIANEIIHQISLKTSTLNDLTLELNSIGHTEGRVVSVDTHSLNAQRAKRVQILKYHDEIDHLIPTLEEWVAKVTGNEARIDLDKSVADIKGPGYTIARSTHQSQLLHRAPPQEDVEGIYHLHEMIETRTPFNNSVWSHHELDKINATRPEKRKVLESCVHNYKRYKQQLNTLAVLRPEQFELERLPALNATIDRLIRDARDKLGPNSGGTGQAPRPSGATSRKRVFETVENLSYLGEETPARGASPRTFTTQGSHGQWQTWVDVGGNRWQQLDDVATTPVQHVSPKRLVTEAQAYLQATDGRIQAIENQAGWTAKDIEDTLLAHARQLRLRADKIASHQADHLVVKQLRDKALELQAKGRDQHVRARLTQEFPEAGDLDYLLEQKAVDVVRSGAKIEMRGQAGGRKDFLQEYEIRDLSQQPPAPLWYVHFHYRTADAPFEQFAKAHIKRLDQKDLGLKWQQAQQEQVPIHRGDINTTMAEKHFRTHYQ